MHPLPPPPQRRRSNLFFYFLRRQGVFSDSFAKLYIKKFCIKQVIRLPTKKKLFSDSTQKVPREKVEPVIPCHLCCPLVNPPPPPPVQLHRSLSIPLLHGPCVRRVRETLTDWEKENRERAFKQCARLLGRCLIELGGGLAGAGWSKLWLS